MSTPTDTNITILVDNKAGEGLVSEHGFSLWIEAESKRILFDTGPGPVLDNNSRALGIDLAAADILVLSHGHYDHTGMVAQVIERARNVDVYCHPGVCQRRYAVRDGRSRAVGMPEQAREALDSFTPQRLHWVEEPVTLADNIGITGPIPRVTSYEDTGGPFYLDAAGTRADPIEDDMALWISTDRGLVVCIGCAHAGVVNTLNHVLHLTHAAHIRAVIGGFHLVNAGRERLARTIAELRLLGADTLITCHCTGEPAVVLLSDALGESVSSGAAGIVYQF